jgi:GH15 family glucan-1,4-alpha-glucosidase
MTWGIIGNCAYSALIEKGSVIWLCWPRMESSFVFGALLDRNIGGDFTVEGIDEKSARVEYVENTNILRTTITCRGGSFELLDFAPRFQLYNRFFKPTMLVRILRPIEGEPLVRVRCRPTMDYGRAPMASWNGSNHVEYTGVAAPLRLTTDVPLTYVQDEQSFVLGSQKNLVLTWGEPLESSLEGTADSFLARTTDYWRRWVKHTRIPRDYQEAVIRSALVLKLHQYEDTGALIAATTTSLPESPGSGRCWDYRYCWLRDAYFTLNAFERLGQTEEMELFLRYLRDLCERHGDRLAPVYRINGGTDMEEKILDHLEGYRGEKPVRIGNQAHEHVQNDVYGEMILAVSRMLMDVRFVGSEGRGSALPLVGRLLAQIDTHLEDPDAGPWELRSEWKLHAFTLLTHWAGAQRAADIGEVHGSEALRTRALRIAARARELLEQRCWNPEIGALTQAAGARNLDASMLLALHFRFWGGDDPRARSHVEAIRKQLSVKGLMRRYDVVDDFGTQESAFTVCSFWLAEALAMVDRKEEARELFERLLSLHNGLGLYSEDLALSTGEQRGNFPQTYSHVGLINAAFRLSRDWA